MKLLLSGTLTHNRKQSIFTGCLEQTGEGVDDWPLWAGECQFATPLPFSKGQARKRTLVNKPPTTKLGISKTTFRATAYDDQDGSIELMFEELPTFCNTSGKFIRIDNSWCGSLPGGVLTFTLTEE
ncbi:MAG: hypothetical protein RI935_251 [Candidatus Parcubacteria bacterium]|jgi:hypothetical protein